MCVCYLFCCDSFSPNFRPWYRSLCRESLRLWRSRGRMPVRTMCSVPFTLVTRPTQPLLQSVDSSWNVMAHGDAREGNWSGNWRMECVASTLHTTLEHGVCSITTADAHTSAASSRLNWRPWSDLNGLVRLAERRNLVSARVPSHFNWSVPKFEDWEREKFRVVYCYSSLLLRRRKMRDENRST